MFSPNTLFYFFSLLLVFNAFMVVIARNPVFSLLFLVASFLSSSFLLFILECEFLALLFVVIYVGAIAILFLFAVMMLESKLVDLSKNTIKYVPIGLIFGIGLLLPLLNEISVGFDNNSGCYSSNFFIQYQNWFALIDTTSDVETCGLVLYTYFAYQLLIAGLILLLVLVGVVTLTNNFNSFKNTDQSIFKQLSRDSKIYF